MTHNPVKQAWLEVGDELESIGLKLKLHLEQETSADEPEAGAFERLAQRIEAAVDAVEHAAADAAVRDDLRESGRRLVEAMSTTYREATRAAGRPRST